MWYFIIAIFALILLVLIFPIRIQLRYSKRHRPKNERNNVLDDIISVNDSYPNQNYLVIYVFYFIPICKLELDKTKSKKGKKKKQKKYEKLRKKIIASDILNTVSNFFISLIDYDKTNKFYFNSKDIKNINKHLKYKKLDLNLGINFFEPIINAYAIAFINAIINIYIAKNVKQFNLSKTTYNTYISQEIYNLRLDLQMSVSLIFISPQILKFLVKNKKAKKSVYIAQNNIYNKHKI